MAITVGQLIESRSEKKYGFRFDLKKVALVYFPPCEKYDTFDLQKSIESRFNTYIRDGVPHDYWGMKPEVEVISVEEIRTKYREYDALVLKTNGAILEKKHLWVCELDVPVFYWRCTGINGFAKTVSNTGKCNTNRYGGFRLIPKGSVAKTNDGWLVLPLEPVLKPSR